jgi:hypothetical protein
VPTDTSAAQVRKNRFFPLGAHLDTTTERRIYPVFRLVGSSASVVLV